MRGLLADRRAGLSAVDPRYAALEVGVVISLPRQAPPLTIIDRFCGDERVTDLRTR
jgi:hypothetical protein